jgi:hypothetical protein
VLASHRAEVVTLDDDPPAAEPRLIGDDRCSASRGGRAAANRNPSSSTSTHFTGWK